MIRLTRLMLITFGCAVLLASPAGAQAGSAPAAAGAAPVPASMVTPAQAAPFLGDWTIASEGPNGPVAFALTVKALEGKVTGEISSDATGKVEVTDITSSGGNLVLNYSIDYQGNAVPVTVTLTPAGETMTVAFSFASGQFEMAGTGTRKK